MKKQSLENLENVDLVNFKKFILLIVERLSNWIELFIQNLPNFFLSIGILAVTWIILKLSKRVVDPALRRASPNKAVFGLFKKIVSILIICTGLFLCLEVLNLDKTVTSILAGAGVIGIALGFAFQEIASNFVSGIFIAFDGPYKIDDIVQLGDNIGTVTSIDMRTTTLRTFPGLEVIVPNKSLFTETFINYTQTPQRRVDLTIGVSYSDDLDLVEKVAKKAVEDIEERISHHDVEVFFHEFGNSSINFDLRFWITYPGNQAYLKAKSKAVKQIKKAFDKEGITIPFPIRTLDFNGSGLDEIINHQKD